MPSLVTHAANILRAGGLVALPTETVYGLGADATHDKAVAAIFARKGRPQFNPLIIHFADVDAVREHVEWNAHAQRLATHFWPGPLTLVLPRKASSPISLLASAGLDTLAVRIPAHDMMLHTIAAAGVPIAAPSANVSGHISPTTADHVRVEFGDDVWVLDGGACRVGLESTVVDVTAAPVLLRLGAVTQAMLEEALSLPVALATHGGNIRSPGQLLKHYAPHKPLRLDATHVEEDEALLAFGKALPNARVVLNLSETGDVQDAAAHLFSMLRALDATDARAIAAQPIPMHGLGAAINDRLLRASQP